MINAFKVPPKTPAFLTNGFQLSEILVGLVGREFLLTGKTRTDGANVRKLVGNEFLSRVLVESADDGAYEIVPPKRKGVPKLLREMLDTYVVTSGKSYNLQVWNRIPNCKTVIVKYDTGDTLKCDDIRYVFVKIDLFNKSISSVVILTADYIVSHFGPFGKPTIKHQLLISKKVRDQIFSSETKLLTYPDTKKMSYLISDIYKEPDDSMACEPCVKRLYSIRLLTELVAKKLVGQKLANSATKNRGQALELMTLQFLGYKMTDGENLVGGFPDIPNQLLTYSGASPPTFR